MVVVGIICTVVGFGLGMGFTALFSYNQYEKGYHDALVQVAIDEESAISLDDVDMHEIHVCDVDTED